MALFPARDFSAVPAVGTSKSTAGRWIQLLAHLGFAARGVVYLVIGGVAVQAALTRSRNLEDSSGALLLLFRQPLGLFLLAILLIGLAGFVLWRLIQAFRDPENKGTDAKGLIIRAGYLVSAVIHAGLAVEAARLLTGSGTAAGGEQSADHWTAVVMAQPYGFWLVGAAGAAVILVGLREIYHGYTADLPATLDLARMGHDARRNVVRFARSGMAARGIVFGLIGGFLIHAALQRDPGEAQGLEASLQTLQEQSYGSILLGVVAMGLIAFGIFQLVEARYRIIRPE
jgi:hypothetical protein